MLGTIANAAAIIIGSLIGIVLKGGIPKKISNTIMQGLALCILFIGISGAISGASGARNGVELVIIISIALGAIIGEALDIDNFFKKLGDNLESKFKGKDSKISEGFVTASLLFCVGAMAVMGSLQSGLEGKHDILFAKSIIDGITSIIFASTIGIGVAFSAAAVFVYQGIMTLASSFLKDLLIQPLIFEMKAVGSLLIMGLGLNMLGVSKIKVANLLPAVFMPILYQIILNLITYIK